MSGLRFPAPLYAELVADLLREHAMETCAFVFTSGGGDAATWLATEYVIAPDDAYEHRDAFSATLKASFLVETANRARASSRGIVATHTHPQARGLPEFSTIDDEGEKALCEYFQRRAPANRHLALVVAREGCRARVLGTDDAVQIWSVGSKLTPMFGVENCGLAEDIFDRQIRAFGAAGQAVIKSLKIGVVGAGGTGSVIIQQLAHLGASNFLIIDPDVVERTNLNRLVGSFHADIGIDKTAIAERAVRQIRPDAEVVTMRRDIVDSDVATELASLDFIFICTDSQASRAVVGQLAYQYLIPAIDMGVSIAVRDGNVTHISGRVQMLAPGLPCLLCTQALDGEQIRREMLTPQQRAADPYVQGFHEPQPAVISINSAMASLAATMFLGATTPVPAGARFQHYDGMKGTVRLATATCAKDCLVCSRAGSLAKGSSWALPVRPKTMRND